MPDRLWDSPVPERGFIAYSGVGATQLANPYPAGLAWKKETISRPRCEDLDPVVD